MRQIYPNKAFHDEVVNKILVSVVAIPSARWMTFSNSSNASQVSERSAWVHGFIQFAQGGEGGDGFESSFKL